jgi:hypothetical protein
MTHSQHAAPTLGSSMVTMDVCPRRHSSQCESRCAAGQDKMKVETYTRRGLPTTIGWSTTFCSSSLLSGSRLASEASTT